MTDIRQRLLSAFRLEYKDHLDFIRGALARLEVGTGLGQGDLDEVFRRAHSLKGAARAVDLRSVEMLAHRLETLFGRARVRAVTLQGPAVAVVDEVLNAVEDCVLALAGDVAAPEPAAALARIDALLAAQGEAVEAPVPAPAPEAAAPAARWPEPPPALAAPEEMIRVAAADLDDLLRSAGQLLVESHGQEAVAQKLRWIEQQVCEIGESWRQLGAGTAATEGERTGEAGAAMHRADAFAQQIRVLAREARAARLQQRRTGWMLRQLAGGLQAEVRRARMVPAESILGGFRKMVRDLARDLGREVDFRTRGLDLRADRMVLQALKDPVMHMLRNAVFHGVEPPAVRRRGGKAATGRIDLTLAIEGNQLALIVEDDGRGLNLGRITEVGLAEGHLGEADIAAMSEHDIARHIFRAGFSTADGVTDVAGRGMGLSVVYQAVARLNGSLDLPLGRDVGTAFRILVPLSIATHRFLLVTAQDRLYAIPTQGIDRLYRVRQADIATVEGRPVITADGHQLFLLSLAELLGLEDPAVVVQDGVVPLVVVKSGSTRVAVAVDGFLSIRDGIVQDLGFPLPVGSKVAGGTLQEDGSVVIVLSPFQLIEACRQPGRSRAVATRERAPVKKVPNILVVDDSITTRTLEKSILVAHGYKVHMAVDGIEALGQLRRQQVDLVVADVQMPRLDGFGLLKEMKKDAQLARIPIILVTSLESRDDRERGLSLGADAYVIKRKFDQRDLLDTIEQLL